MHDVAKEYHDLCLDGSVVSMALERKGGASQLGHLPPGAVKLDNHAAFFQQLDKHTAWTAHPAEVAEQLKIFVRHPDALVPTQAHHHGHRSKLRTATVNGESGAKKIPTHDANLHHQSAAFSHRLLPHI